MNERIQKIDAHSHIGKSYTGPESTYEGYIDHAKRIGVVGGVISPEPSPEVVTQNGYYYPCLWRLEGSSVVYERVLKSKNGDILQSHTASKNPYHEFNEKLLRRVANEHRIQLWVMPIHHPILDTAEEMRSMILDHPSIAIKMHGIATFTGPKDIPEFTIDYLRQSEKPIVVHTDRVSGSLDSPFTQACKMNEPLDWVDWAQDTGVKILLTHGARLTEPAIEKAKTLPNVMIGIAPDLLIASDPARLATPTEDYLSTLLSMATPDKLMFDIDYAWNVAERGKWEAQDWLMHERLVNAARITGVKDRELHNVFYHNAVSFFAI